MAELYTGPAEPRGDGSCPHCGDRYRPCACGGTGERAPKPAPVSADEAFARLGQALAAWQTPVLKPGDVDAVLDVVRSAYHRRLPCSAVAAERVALLDKRAQYLSGRVPGSSNPEAVRSMERRTRAEALRMRRLIDTFASWRAAP